MIDFDSRINNLDITLFNSIPSQTFDEDKRSLLLIQSIARKMGNYIYLEIGSHLGGTIQTFFMDPECRLIYSIDKRPSAQPDQRGKFYYYNGNSTDRMVKNLSAAFPSTRLSKLITFDSDAKCIPPKEISEKPNFCFIDGEHTNRAVYSDFLFCLKVCHPDAVIAFHDTCYIIGGIEKIKNHLRRQSIKYRGVILGGSVYVILLNEAVQFYGEDLDRLATDEQAYFKSSKTMLKKIRLKHLKERLKKNNPKTYAYLGGVKKALGLSKNHRKSKKHHIHT